MSNVLPTPALPPGQAARLAALLDARWAGWLISDGVSVPPLAWLAGFEACTVANIATVITRAR